MRVATGVGSDSVGGYVSGVGEPLDCELWIAAAVVKSISWLSGSSSV
jgi:hypothetical protein